MRGGSLINFSSLCGLPNWLADGAHGVHLPVRLVSELLGNMRFNWRLSRKDLASIEVATASDISELLLLTGIHVR